MTAFAAIVSVDGRANDQGCREVARALTAFHATAPVVHASSGCVLLASRFPESDDDVFVTDPNAGVSAVGHVVLEGRDALAAELDLNAGASALHICVAAYRRWGERCTSRLSGEFSFALWDDRQRALLCARDGLGVRQAFVARGARAVVISNVLGGAVAHPGMSRRLDDTALVQFAATGSIGDGRTAYRSVSTLPAGHTLRLDGQRARLWRHWHFPETGAAVIRDHAQAVAGYRDVLEQAVKDRVTAPRVSILLSGGIDSTSIAAAARSAVPVVQVKAFTAIYNRMPQESELSRAAAAAAALGIPIVPVVGDRHEALHHLLEPHLLPQPVDEPALSDWRALLAAAATHSSVALYGEDGDSLFLPPGYAAQRRSASLPCVVRDALTFAASNGHLPYLGLRLRERVGVTAAPEPHIVPAWLSSNALALLGEGDAPSVLGQRPDSQPPHATRPEACGRLRVGVAGYLAGIIATETTCVPIELRCPLLDTRVVRFVMNVAPVPWCQRKRLPREAYRRVLPAAVHMHPKRGVKGLDGALAREWRARTAREPTLPPPLDEWIDPDAWRRAVSDPLAVAGVWRVLQLAAWLRGRTKAPEAPEYLCTA
jgi:asparagine synthase (glutamine-hydrolysing)